MLLLPGSLEHMGDWDGLGMTTRGLRVGGDVGWGGAGGRGRGGGGGGGSGGGAFLSFTYYSWHRHT